MKKNCVICGNEFEAIRFAKTCGTKCSHELKLKGNRERMREWFKDPANRKHERDLRLKRYEDPARRELILARNRQRHRELLKDPAKHKQRCEQLRKRELERMKNPVYLERSRARKLKHRREWLKDPTNRELARTRDREHQRKKRQISPATQKFFLAMKLGEAFEQQQNNSMKTQVDKPVMSVNQFIEAFKQKMLEVEQLCIELANMVDVDPDIYDKIVKACPSFNRQYLIDMEKIGRGRIDCRLGMDGSEAARHLMSLELPLAIQRRVYNEELPIVRLVNSKEVIEQKLWMSMSRAERNQVADSEAKKIRTIEEQRAYIKSPVDVSSAKTAERFTIDDEGSVYVMPKTKFTLSNLEDILQRAKAKAIKSLATKK